MTKNNPYERNKAVFTPEFIKTLAEKNKEYRFKKYPVLKDLENLLQQQPIRGKK